ncbi:Molybdopterin binding protein [Violaceomyces palustris]|uniref:Molybdopterin binding protein n=1 Tax=Violaceomyces palustris TaxID=1673888 RepID=A0ACD0NVG1_9BASI|nr:Molybdopterin binding protein [Violaceomyces palustris]
MSSSEPNQAQQQQQGEKLAQLSPEKMPRFQKTPLGANPLGEGNYVKTAACLIIGDEVLNGKTKDSNSNYFAKFCFNLGIELKKIEVIPDEEDVIVEAARRLTSQHELVITSGGIGPTPDDITYQSIAKAFDAEPLVYHDETLDRMSKNIAARRLSDAKPTDEMILARKRMALFPSKDVEVIFPTEQLWVPVVRMKGRLCILPGVPRLFEGLLDGLESYIPIDPNRPRPYRMLIHTMLPESNISPFLVRLTEKCKPEGIKVGSYPKWNNGVDVSLIGDNLDRLKELGQEVEKELDGKILEAGKIGESKI